MGSTGMSIKKKRKLPGELQPIASLKSKIETDLALGAETTRVKKIDPINYVTEGFRSTFDLTGKYNASQFGGDDFSDSRGEIYRKKGEKEKFGNNVQSSMQEPQQVEPAIKLWRDYPSYESTAEEKAKGRFLKKFSEIAFHNGRLASAVMQNGGKTMFVACLKRALAQSVPTNSIQSKLFSISSVKVSLRNSQAKVVLNSYTNSAIELVMESILSSRRTLQLFELQASDDSEKAVLGMKDNIIRNVYPFLTISNDAERLVEYEEKLNELTLLNEKTGDIKKRNEIARQKAVLNVGITKMQGLISRKSQLQNQFFSRLEQFLENSRKAEAIFTSPSFADNVTEEFMDTLELNEDGRDDQDDQNEDKPKKPLGEKQ